MKKNIKENESLSYLELVKAPLFLKFIFEPCNAGGSTSSFKSYRNHQLIRDALNIPDMKFNNYCINCMENRIFSLSENINQTENWIKSGGRGQNMFVEGIRFHEFECALNTKHRIQFTYKVGENFIIKIGQFPSTADLEVIEKKYENILGQEKYFEFKRAIGLNSFGVGIGSFIYLRRIVEEIIEQAYNYAKQDINWDDNNYKAVKVKEKIKLLKNYLPEFFISNNAIYGILSKGIHELNEKDCLLYFPVLKEAIEIILDEQIEKMEKTKKMATMSKAINAINSKLS